MYSCIVGKHVSCQHESPLYDPVRHWNDAVGMRGGLLAHEMMQSRKTAKLERK